jgi:NAD(P)H-dependent FMN reductase
VMNAEAPALAPVAALRAAAADADAALVITPEYNGSYPAVIKNAIDWLSRPFGDGALKGKPLAVIGGSFGQYGGVWAHDDTRKSFGIAGARVIEAVKLSVPFKTLGGKHPREHAEVSANVLDAVGKLATEVN